MSAPRATVVLVHGPWLGPWIWHAHLLPRLEALGMRCFAPDLHEAWPRPDWSPAVARLRLDEYVARLHAFVAGLRGPVVLIGHSLGARVVEGLIERRAPAGAVLIAPVPPSGLEAEARALAARHPADAAAALLARRPLRLLGDPSRPDPARVRELLLGPRASAALAAEVAARLRDEPFAACLEWLRPRPVPPPGARPPVLALGGRDDPLVTPAALRRAGAAWDATVHALPHAGHCPMLGDAAPALARRIEDWLSG